MAIWKMRLMMSTRQMINCARSCQPRLRSDRAQSIFPDHCVLSARRVCVSGLYVVSVCLVGVSCLRLLSGIWRRQVALGTFSVIHIVTCPIGNSGETLQRLLEGFWTPEGGFLQPLLRQGGNFRPQRRSASFCGHSSDACFAASSVQAN